MFRPAWLDPLCRLVEPSCHCPGGQERACGGAALSAASKYFGTRRDHDRNEEDDGSEGHHRGQGPREAQLAPDEERQRRVRPGEEEGDDELVEGCQEGEQEGGADGGDA